MDTEPLLPIAITLTPRTAEDGKRLAAGLQVLMIRDKTFRLRRGHDDAGRPVFTIAGWTESQLAIIVDRLVHEHRIDLSIGKPAVVCDHQREPMMGLQIRAPEACRDDIVGDLKKRRGRVLWLGAHKGRALILAQAPMADLFGYGATLQQLTQQRAEYQMHVSHYQRMLPTSSTVSDSTAGQSDDAPARMPLVAFFRGGRDDRGRTLDEVLGWDWERLESTHDYIQWLFPLRERSGANPGAPTLSADEVAAFRTDAALGDQMRRALRIMLDFYGFMLIETDTPEMPSSPPTVRRSPHCQSRWDVWLEPRNHNYLRLTRILKSLRTLGLEAEARATFEALQTLSKGYDAVIGPTTYAFWQRAMEDETLGR